EEAATKLQLETVQPRPHFLYINTESVCSTPPSHLNIKNCISVVDDLVLIPVHTKPKDSLKELDELHDVVEDIRKKWKTDKKKEKIRICSSSYNWLIDDDVDTTASNNNDNTYDRIVVYGETMMNAIVPNSAKSFNFQQEFKLTDEETLDISDHYPVEVELKTKDASGEGQSKKKGYFFISDSYFLYI
uniref:Uncharacterized protein n=1 Tax=Neolamprologus brichardi TaxID=32507 RepID=A0A3Q4H0Q4_NEOBR